jgi:hypothetical protein
MGVLFAHSTWPKAVDEDTTARPFLAMVIDAVNLDPERLPYPFVRSPRRRGRAVRVLGWRMTLGGIENFERESLNLFEVESGQCFESGGPVLGEMQPNDAMIVIVATAPDEASGVGPIDEPDRAVVAEKQVIGHFTDGRPSRIGMASNGEEQLMLSGSQAGRTSLLFAPPFKAA